MDAIHALRGSAENTLGSVSILKRCLIRYLVKG